MPGWQRAADNAPAGDVWPLLSLRVASDLFTYDKRWFAYGIVRWVRCRFRCW